MMQNFEITRAASARFLDTWNIVWASIYISKAIKHLARANEIEAAGRLTAIYWNLGREEQSE